MHLVVKNNFSKPHTPRLGKSGNAAVLTKIPFKRRILHEKRDYVKKSYYDSLLA